MKTCLIRSCALAVAVIAGGTGRVMAQAPGGRIVRGTVYDSLSSSPLEGAEVSLLSRSDTTMAPRNVQTDSSGQFRFSEVPPGVYLIGFQHPLIDSLGLRTPVRVLRLAESGDKAAIVDLAVPSGRTVHDAFCPNRPARDSSSVFLGHLGDASTRGVVAKGLVEATWLAIVRTRKTIALNPGTVTTHTANDGWFALCDLPASTTISLQASRGTDSTGAITFMTPDTRGLIRRELYLPGDTGERGGVVRGLVVNADDHRAIANAQVREDRAGTLTTSSQNGQFTLTGLAYGTSTISVRSIGHLPQTVPVDILAGAPADVTVTLLTQKNVLDTVRVRASRTIADENGFNERRKAGWGRFFDSEAIDRMQPFETSDIVRHSAGVRVVTAGFDSRIMMRNPENGHWNCPPVYYLDGRKLLGIETTRDLEMVAPPEELAAVEVYNDPMAVPGQFDGGFACGAVVMWSLPPNLWGRRGHD
jgi:hypothetical protein